jgi:chromosomal replication initiator protein
MLSVETILAAVAAECDVSVAALWSRSRVGHIVIARQIACALLRELRPDLSLEAIGVEVNRDHTTVIYALRRIAERQHESPDVVQRIAQIRARLGVVPPAPVVVRGGSWGTWWVIQGLTYEAVSA